MARSTRFRARLQRHQPDLPVYVIVPDDLPARLGHGGTFVVEARSGDTGLGRRSVKPWGDGRWFMELTKSQLALLAAGPGDEVEVELREAPAEHRELMRCVEQQGLGDAWRGLSEAQRRQMTEPVFAARRDATREARIAKVLRTLRAGR